MWQHRKWGMNGWKHMTCIYERYHHMGIWVYMHFAHKNNCLWPHSKKKPIKSKSVCENCNSPWHKCTEVPHRATWGSRWSYWTVTGWLQAGKCHMEGHLKQVSLYIDYITYVLHTVAAAAASSTSLFYRNWQNINDESERTWKGSQPIPKFQKSQLLSCHST
jgi:hypothetical protein